MAADGSWGAGPVVTWARSMGSRPRMADFVHADWQADVSELLSVIAGSIDPEISKEELDPLFTFKGTLLTSKCSNPRCRFLDNGCKRLPGIICQFPQFAFVEVAGDVKREVTRALFCDGDGTSFHGTHCAAMSECSAGCHNCVPQVVVIDDDADTVKVVDLTGGGTRKPGPKRATRAATRRAWKDDAASNLLGHDSPILPPPQIEPAEVEAEPAEAVVDEVDAGASRLLPRR
ncbi:hypothetical protein BC828DRAFT_52873 [Blastocladiella britannica]|nr:hypothetical protein BC828DRAFT_52873 [Blastocladiella britannica]